MDDLFSNSNSNSNEGLSLVSASSNQAVYSGNFYEVALRKIVNIFKTKTVDNLKQLEELWESVNAPRPQQTSPVTLQSSINTETSVKRDFSKLSPNPTSNSVQSVAKKPKLGVTPTPTSKQLPTLPAKMATVNSSVNLSKSSKITPSQDTKTTSSAPCSKIESASSTITVFASSSVVNVAGGNFTEKIKFEDINSVVDMLDNSCVTCKLFSYDTNNRLIECRKCFRLFHQQCHNPPIDNSKIESSKQPSRISPTSALAEESNGNSKHQFAWFIDKCEACLKSPVSLSLPCTVSSSTECKNSYETESNTNVSFEIKSESPQPTAAAAIVSPPIPSFGNTFKKPVNELSKPLILTKTLDSDKTAPTNGGVKGFAALVTKLNPTPLNKLQNTTNTSGDLVATKINQNDLFNKFKQTNAIKKHSSSTPPSAASSAASSNNNIAASVTSLPAVSANNCSMSSNPPKNIFNMNSVAKPNLVAIKK